MMEIDLRIRVKVLELLSASLKAEHFQDIQQICSDYHHVDHGGPSKLLHYLEKKRQCISMKSYYGLTVLLNQIGLGELANEILELHEIPEEKYIDLKTKIEEIFTDRKYRKEYMGKLKNVIVDCYKLKFVDIEHCTVKEIIKDLEDDQLLSNSSSHIFRFQKVFKSCGCSSVVELINSMENVIRIKEETSIDTNDHQHMHHSQSTQEQNPGRSESTTGRHPSTFTPGSSEPTTAQHSSTFNPTSGHWQNPGSSEPTGAGQTAGFHQSANLHPDTFQRLQGITYTSNVSNVGTNINFGPNCNLTDFHVSSGNPGLGVYGRANYGPQHWNQGQGGPGQGLHGHGSPGQGNHGQGHPGQGIYGQRNYGHGQGYVQGGRGQGSPGQGIPGQGSPGQGIPRQDDYGHGHHGQGAHQYFPRP